MPLRHFRRQYEQISQFERRRIIGMMEAGWSAGQVARQFGRCDCVPTFSSAAIQHVAPLGAPVSSRTIRWWLAEGHLGLRCPLRVLSLTPTHRRLHLEWFRARGNWTAEEWNLVVLSDENPDSISVMMA
ncbi:transposable element Tcb2 transposase [Trichonephila clavipes]|nr:transposable element Tcb2 transposase [Trichonephila clavipes]